MTKIKVGILGATGAVGQRFAQMLAGHPFFELVVLTGSERSAGKKYKDAARWILPQAMPTWLGEMTIQETSTDLDCQLFFSALPTQFAHKWESKLAAAGYGVFSNAGAHRMDQDVEQMVSLRRAVEVRPSSTAVELFGCAR